MNIRIFGAIMIIVGCSAYGFILVSAYRRELKALSQFLEFLDRMECELLYKGSSLPVLLECLSINRKGMIYDFLKTLTAELNAQIQPHVNACVSAALQKHQTIPPQTKQMLIKFGQTLGQYAQEGQILEIRALKQELRQQIAKLEAEKDTKTKTYQTLSICAGAAIAVIFM